MPISVIMPQMGESIFEGTVTKWLKKVGDRITRDEPLFEVSTDKVDSEIPSSVDGVLSEIVVLEGQTVKVGTVVAIIGKLDAAGETPIMPEKEAAGVAPADETVTVAEEVQPATPSAEPAEVAVVPEAAPETAPSATPAAEAAPIEESTPVHEAFPVAEAASVTEAAPAAEAASVEESTPVHEASPVAEAASVTDAAPAAEAIPVEESTPVHEASPVAEAASVTDAAPAAEAIPVKESTPVHEAAPVTEATPVAETEAEAIQPPEIELHTDITEEPQVLIRTSPLVRRIARDYDVDLSVIRGTGLSGRITKQDIVGFLERHGKKEVQVAQAPEAPAISYQEPATPPAPVAPTLEPIPIPQPPEPPTAAPAAPVEPRETAPFSPIEPQKFYGETETITMTPMRKAIAEHMVLSKKTSAHVQTFFEVDMTSIVQLREKHKDEFQARAGINLNYTAFFVKALVDTVRDFPILNCSVSGDQVVLKKAVNVGIAVALDTGLIVPVIKDAHLKNLTDLALSIHDLADRSRTKRLKPEEVQHGTITVTNPGIYGSLFGTPIINQPQVAILCVGSIQKRPVIINDAIAIRSMVYLVLSFDHRVIDGATADQSMSALKSRLQSWSQWE